MTIKFRAYAAIKDDKGEWKRLEQSTHEAEKDAEKAIADFSKKYKGSETGIHKYYIISRKEWKNERYTGVSLEDGKTKTWMTNEGNGCVLLFESTHFEIV